MALVLSPTADTLFYFLLFLDTGLAPPTTVSAPPPLLADMVAPLACLPFLRKGFGFLSRVFGPLASSEMLNESPPLVFP